MMPLCIFSRRLKGYSGIWNMLDDPQQWPESTVVFYVGAAGHFCEPHLKQGDV
jgi:hypothetical protein